MTADKIGASLRELTMIPEDAPQEEIEYLFIYEKNGLRETFNMEDLPDSTSVSYTHLDVYKRQDKGRAHRIL